MVKAQESAQSASREEKGFFSKFVDGIKHIASEIKDSFGNLADVGHNNIQVNHRSDAKISASATNRDYGRYDANHDGHTSVKEAVSGISKDVAHAVEGAAKGLRDAVKTGISEVSHATQTSVHVNVGGHHNHR